MNKPPATDDDLTRLAGALRRIVQGLDSHSKLLETRVGLTASQLLCLQVLAQQGCQSASRLAAAVSLTPGTISLVLDRLEAKGLVQRLRSDRDRRQFDLVLTDAGRERLQIAPGVLPAVFVQRFATLSPSRQKRLAQSLDDLMALMQPSKEPTRTA
jgi:DNA-binding MarR family transcriptional regulator